MADRSPRRGELWSADLHPRRGSEPGKVRPVVVVQSDLLNETDHPSMWILPCTTQLAGENVLRVELPARIAGNARGWRRTHRKFFRGIQWYSDASRVR